MVKVANAAGIPGIEVELGGMGISLPENRARYRAHLLSLMRHLGMLEGEAAPHPGARVFRGRHLLAPRGGVLDLAVRLEDEVAEGGLLARIRDLHGRCVAEVRAPLAGLIAAHRTFIPVAPGDHIVTLFHDGAPA
jgi:predicted deacylase